MKRSLLAVIAATVLGLTGCGGDDDGGSDDSTTEENSTADGLRDAYEKCSETLRSELTAEFGADSTPLDEVFRLEDSEESPTILVNPPTGSLATPFIYDAVVCVLDETGAPATVEQKLGASNAMSGPQSETYDGITFDWSVGSQLGSATLTASFALK